MDILYFTYPINGILMIFLPILLGIYLARKYGLRWRLWWIGAVTFVLSQVGHIPFNVALDRGFAFLPSMSESMSWIVNAIVLGLSAGLWEEIARYAAYRWWAKDARSWSKGLMLGAGHGGIESILLGILVLWGFINVLVAGSMDLFNVMSPEEAFEAQRQIQAYWSAPWAATLLGALERVLALILHLSFSLMVLQVFIRRQNFWLWLAFLWHALVDASAVYAAIIWGTYESEVLIAGFALIGLAVIFLLRPSDQREMIYHEGGEDSIGSAESGDTPQLADPLIPDVEETPENIDRTRYA
jgi:uncharacterized membrane protein YhfC